MLDDDRDLESGHRPADVSLRIVALSVDLGLFALGAWLTLLALPAAQAILRQPLWLGLWGLLFFLYEGYASCEGRRTLGKALLGLRVVDLNGEPLGLGQAVVRAAGLLVSALPLGLGFLWALFNPARQGWHDLAAASVVVEDGPKPAILRLALRGAALACLLVMGLAAMWRQVWGPRYDRLMTLAYVQVGLKHISVLQRGYRRDHGRYAKNIFALSSQSADPETFLNDMASLFDLDAGFEIKTTPKNYMVLARARDVRRTPIRFVGS